MRSGRLVALATMSAIVAGAWAAASGVPGAAASAVPVITTIAGGDGAPGPGTSAAVEACGLSASASQTYITGFGVAWRLDPASGRIQPVAGVGGTVNGDASNGVPALTAGLNGACGIATDGHGNLVMATRANEIRVVAGQSGAYYGQNMLAGRIYTIAGTGKWGFAGDGGPATQALLNDPQDVSLDGTGNVVITDAGNNRVRVLAAKTGTFYGHSMKAGDIYTVLAKQGVRNTMIDRSGNLVGSAGTQVWVYAEKPGTYYGRAMNGGTLYTIETGTSPPSLALDNAGNVVFSGTFVVKVVAGSTGTFYGQSMTAGQAYTIAGGGANLTGNGVPALQALIRPLSLASLPSGALVIGEQFDARVVPQATGTYYGQAMTAGDIYTAAGNGLGYSGDGGPATHAVLPRAGDTVADASGNILILSGAGVRCLAGQSGTFYGQQMTKGDIYTIYRTPSAGYPKPYRLSVDTSGNLVFAAAYGQQEHAAVLAEHTGTYYGVPMTAGNVYSLYVNRSDYGLADVRSDRQGNLLITLNESGEVLVLAGQSGVVYGHYLAAGHNRLLAGGGPAPVQNGIPANQAYLQRPAETHVDSAGNLVISDAGDNMIRVVAAKSGIFYGQAMKAGDIYTVAGNGQTGPDKNNIPALSAALNDPQAAMIDSAGNIVIADTNHNQVRVVASKTGNFYGEAMKAGFIYLLAGTGKPAFGGDGGPASKAWLTSPYTLTTLRAGGVLVSDDTRVRLITP